MRVALVHDFDEARLFGIREYARRLKSAIGERCESADVFPSPAVGPGPGLSGPVRTWVMKEIVYPWQVRSLSADVYHVLDQSHAHLLRSLPRGPKVATCHDLIPLRHASPLRRILYRRRVGALAGATRVIAVSDWTRRELVASLGLDPARIRVIPNPLDPFFFGTPALETLSEVRDRFALAGREIVLHVGAVLPYKNLDRALRAVGRLTRGQGGSPPPLFVKVGAALTPELRRIAEEARVEARSLGDLDRKTLRAVYHLASVLLYPSLDEGFGWPVAEAMACGLPVVCSRSGALPEVTGGAALEVEATDVGEMAGALERLRRDPERRRRQSMEGRARAMTLAGGDFAAAMLGVYREACGDES